MSTDVVKKTSFVLMLRFFIVEYVIKPLFQKGGGHMKRIIYRSHRPP